MARGNCLYCGATLSTEVLEAAALAAQRVLKSKSFANLEVAAIGLDLPRVPRRYVVLETVAATAETISFACSVSLWEAKQWQVASRYRLLKITTEPGDGFLEVSMREKGLLPIVIPEEIVERGRSPVHLESIDVFASPVRCTIRDDPEAAPSSRDLLETEISIIVSAPIKIERVREQTSRIRPAISFDDAWLVHIHLKNEARPWEIDPRRTGYQGPGLASAHMRTIELVRRLSAEHPYDDSFRNVVPALSPGIDPRGEIESPAKARKSADKGPKSMVLDNIAQFREYSAWRAAIERARSCPVVSR